MQEAIVIFGGSLIVVLLTRLPSRLSPYHYFAFGELISGFENVPSRLGLAIRFATPFSVALIAAAIIGEQQREIGASIGFLAAFLIIWPAVLNPTLRSSATYGREREAILVYSMFIGAFAIVGLAGGLLASWLEEPLARLTSDDGVNSALDSMEGRLDDLVLGVVASFLGIGLLAGFVRAYHWLLR